MDNEVSETGNTNTAQFWEYDTILGSRWNSDPRPTNGISEYACFGNNPIWASDLLGDILRTDGQKMSFDDIKSIAGKYSHFTSIDSKNNVTVDYGAGMYYNPAHDGSAASVGNTYGNDFPGEIIDFIPLKNKITHMKTICVLILILFSFNVLLSQTDSLEQRPLYCDFDNVILFYKKNADTLNVSIVNNSDKHVLVLNSYYNRNSIEIQDSLIINEVYIGFCSMVFFQPDFSKMADSYKIAPKDTLQIKIPLLKAQNYDFIINFDYAKVSERKVKKNYSIRDYVNIMRYFKAKGY